jgi:hypothetical protein
MSHCSLSGPIPPELGKLTRLEHPSLSNNRFSSQISSQLGQLSNLIVLELVGCNLSGPIPGGFRNGIDLLLNNNNLLGQVPLYMPVPWKKGAICGYWNFSGNPYFTGPLIIEH